MVTRDQIRQYPAMQPELVYRVLCPSSRVINTARRTFKMGFGVITRRRHDKPLKFRTVLSQVVPKPCHVSPVAASKNVREFSGTTAYFSQMLFKVVGNKDSSVLSDMRQIAKRFKSLHVPVHG